MIAKDSEIGMIPKKKKVGQNWLLGGGKKFNLPLFPN